MGDLPIENPDLFGGDILGVEDFEVSVDSLFYYFFITCYVSLKHFTWKWHQCGILYIYLVSVVQWDAVVLSVDHSAPDRRARVRDSPDETPPWTLMTPGAKICCGCNVLQVPIQNYTSGGTKMGEIEIVMACPWIILRDESQTVGNSPLALL